MIRQRGPCTICGAKLFQRPVDCEIVDDLKKGGTKMVTKWRWECSSGTHLLDPPHPKKKI